MLLVIIIVAILSSAKQHSQYQVQVQVLLIHRISCFLNTDCKQYGRTEIRLVGEAEQHSEQDRCSTLDS